MNKDFIAIFKKIEAIAEKQWPRDYFRGIMEADETGCTILIEERPLMGGCQPDEYRERISWEQINEAG